MLISATTVCSLIDGRPLADSPAHNLLRSLIGCAAASMTYEDTISLHPPPEVQHDRPNLMDMGAQRRYQSCSIGRISVAPAVALYVEETAPKRSRGGA